MYGYRKFSKNSASLIIWHLLHYNEIISLKIQYLQYIGLAFLITDIGSEASFLS